MSKTNTEKLNSLKVGDSLHTIGIGDFKFNSLLSATIGFKYYEFYSNETSIDEFKVAYVSADYVLISWWDYTITFISR